jgi:hypothetical protein
VGLIPGEVTGFFFNLPNPFSRTMALGLTQPLREMSTRNLSGVKTDSLTAICLEDVTASMSHNPMGLHGLLQGQLYLLFLLLTQ